MKPVQTPAESEPIGFDVEVNNIRIHGHDWGGSGRPILIMHATGMLDLLYAPIARALAAVGHVYSYDQRGHGDSAHPEDAVYDWEHQLQDLKAIVQALDLRELRGIGHSAGATLLATLSAEQPDAVAGLVMIEPVLVSRPRGLEIETAMVQRTINRRAVFADADAMYANFAGKPPYNTWRPDILRKYCEHGAAPNSQGLWELKCRPAIEASFYASVGRFRTLERALGCRAKSLVIFGTRGNASTGAEHAHLLKEELPAVEIVELPEYGHLVAMEDPDLIAHLAVDFLRQV
jgi:pimeloyl-ACP methyl ester carboxylesterase